MSGGSSSEWRPQGEGPHPTLAGNILDPGVKADGKMSHGQGVGGTSESHIREEGLEHIKKNTDSPYGDSSTSTTGGFGSGGIGGEGASSGISQEGSGQGGIMSTVKDYLGLGGAGAGAAGAGTAGSNEPLGSRSAETSGLGDTTGEYGRGTEGLGGSTEPLGGRSAESSYGTDPATTGRGTSATDRAEEYAAGGAATAGAGAAGLAAETTGSDRAGRVAEDENLKAEQNLGTSGSRMGDTENGETTVTDRGSQQEGAAVSEKKRHDDDKVAAKRENTSAIPYAGDERLGEKHWGESKIVPDVPKARDSDAGVSSSSGQPTDEVRDNTSRNTGGASAPGGHGAEEKEGLVDKIKDKLHMGHK